MEALVQRVLKDEPAVNQRLRELGLSKDGLLLVRTQAMAAGADATPDHPANAAGLLAYIQGVASLRRTFVGQDWRSERIENMEFIRNDELNMRVGFSNVKVAANDQVNPQARSPKGAGAARVCPHTMDLFQSNLEVNPFSYDEVITYFLMVDTNGAAELTRPTVESSNYREYLERIYLSDGSDFDGDSLIDDQGDDIADDFDPIVARR